MIRIRLARYGSKNNPFYRIVAIDKRRKNKGKPIDIIGYWHPQKGLKDVDSAKYNAWLKKGAIATPSVEKILK